MTKNDDNGQWIKKLFTNKDEKKKRSSPIQYLAIVMCVGLALMIFSNFSKTSGIQESIPVFKEETKDTSEVVPVFTSKNSGDGPLTMQDYEYTYEKQLRDVLEQIVGVSDVHIMINLAETETKVFERNISTKEQKTDETDREGGKRKVEDVTRDNEVVVIRTGDKEEPLIAKTEKPSIRGVLVVARGVENIQVKTWVVEAVSRVLDVPSHRVSVLPKKSKGE
ncbi:stage III sporulation protein AG [Anaerobacillus isosaccharinicus]|uniref:Stage III sporulation protein AG n=1 Tax=Anaerobacillus isosaccharinicus TaxID=1532552 RepID=A0A1S2MEZ5_9BACI|nr:stage III sporulation protein AG [Anaerobacillus isosaccharinicus]MBA5585616.1 stage III sporulation protein AG [Anaerobacillus isosaccharinicus]QOY36074.1 stage III sporulation protein AG [Anaerobacillus isosaccharinicus]